MGIKLHETVRDNGDHYSWVFRCPACQDMHQCDARWTFNGDVERPTFDGSVLVYPATHMGKDGKPFQTPRCHSYVRDGRIEFLDDCTHALAGKTVDLPDWDAQ